MIGELHRCCVTLCIGGRTFVRIGYLGVPFCMALWSRKLLQFIATSTFPRHNIILAPLQLFDYLLLTFAMMSTLRSHPMMNCHRAANSPNVTLQQTTTNLTPGEGDDLRAP